MKKNLLSLIAAFICFASAIYSFGQSNPPNGEEWYLRTEDKTAELYVYEIGKGEPVAVVHGGFGAEHSSLLDAVNGLENNFRFIFYDQRGSLRSPSKPESISIENHIQDLETIRKELGVEKMTIFAHSNGTLLTMHYLQKHPGNVKNIVFVGAVSPKRGTSLGPSEKAIMEDSQKAFQQFVQRSEVKEEYKKFGFDAPKRTAKEETALFKISFAAGNIYDVKLWRQMKGGKVFWSQEAANATAKTLAKDYDFTPALKQHPYQITAIAGDHDLADFGNGIWKKVPGELPNIKLIIIEKAGHNPWIDKPVVFRNALRKALPEKRRTRDAAREKTERRQPTPFRLQTFSNQISIQQSGKNR